MSAADASDEDRRTGGSTDTRGLFLVDDRAMAVAGAVGARVLSGWLRPAVLPRVLRRVIAHRGRVALVVATGGHFASAAAAVRLGAGGGRRRIFSVDPPLAELVARLDEFQSAVLAPYATTAALPAGRAVAHGADHESGQPGSADPAVRPRRQRPATARPVSLLTPAGPGVTLPLTPRLDDFPASRASRSSRSPPPNCSCACKPRPGPSRKTPGRPPTTSCPMSSPRTAGHVTIRRAADGPRPGPGGKYRLVTPFGHTAR